MAWSLLVLALAMPGAAAGYTFEPGGHLEHRDQWGVALHGGLALSTSVRPDEVPRRLRQPALELEVSHGDANTGDEWLGRLRLSVPLPGTLAGVGVGGGYRIYAGREALKTWVSLEAWLLVQAVVAAGGRLSVGGTWELSRTLGLFLGFGARAGGGTGLIVGFDFLAGAQFRWP